jgi:hypothetical protein
MSSLAHIRDRVEQLLLDTANLIYPAALIDEALRLALDQYNLVNPLGAETVITLPAAGREIALDSLTGLLYVTEVWWPYDSTASAETWPPNQVQGFRLWWDDARPVLFLDIPDGPQPQLDDELRLWYAKRQTIADLDSAAITSLRADHESLIVLGAAGHAAMSRAADLVEISGTDLYQVGVLATWGKVKLREFAQELGRLQRHAARQGPSWGCGWILDKWDLQSP